MPGENPYIAPRAESSLVSERAPSRRRSVLAVLLSIALGFAFGAVWFMIENAIDPFLPLDVRFYFNLYTEIGAASGFFSWYMATLVGGGHVRLGCASLILAIPFLLAFLLSPGYAVILLFAMVAIPPCVVAGIRQRGDCRRGDAMDEMG
jgi:hypothetical protein